MFGTMNCAYETPCGWCTKWDKKCDKKIGCGGDKPQRGLRAEIGVYDDAAEQDIIDEALKHLYEYSECTSKLEKMIKENRDETSNTKTN